jgi:hypothetical protein
MLSPHLLICHLAEVQDLELHRQRHLATCSGLQLLAIKGTKKTQCVATITADKSAMQTRLMLPMGTVPIAFHLPSAWDHTQTGSMPWPLVSHVRQEVYRQWTAASGLLSRRLGLLLVHCVQQRLQHRIIVNGVQHLQAEQKHQICFAAGTGSLLKRHNTTSCITISLHVLDWNKRQMHTVQQCDPDFAAAESAVLPGRHLPHRG